MNSFMNKLTAMILSSLMATSFIGCSQPEAGAEPTSSQTETSQDGTGANVPADENTDATEDDGTGDEWKNNVGSISLGDTITYEGEGISVEGSTVHITAGGDYTVAGTLADGMIHVNTTDKVKLRLNGVDITNASGPAIFFEDSKKSFITISSGTTNTLTDGSSYSVEAKATLFSNDTLEIKGSGTLNITGNYNHGIASDDDVLIEKGTINILSTVTDGIHANDNVTITGGTLNVKAGSDGIDSEGDVVITGGSLAFDTSDDGVHAGTELTVDGGDINITNSYEGLEGKTTVTINGGNIRIIASDDPINSGTDLTINDGYIYAEGGGDGIDSNGNLYINGGTLITYGGLQADGPIDFGDRGYECVINGGTVIAGGGNMSEAVREQSGQYSVWIGGNLAAGTLVNISSADGIVETFALAKQVNLLFYCSDKLVADTEYNVSTGGSCDGQQTDGLYRNGSYTGGSQLGSFTTSAKGSSVGNAGMSGGRQDMGGTRPEGAMPDGMTPPEGGMQPGQRGGQPEGEIVQPEGNQGTDQTTDTEPNAI